MNYRNILAFVVSLSLILPAAAPISLAQQVHTPKLSKESIDIAQYNSYQTQMNNMQAFLEELGAELNRTAFAVDALLDSLEYDAESIIGFTKSAVAFEQYPGVLRGPTGTLFSRAGNAIDQSLFLANLLREAGYDARVAGGRVSEDDAAHVLKALKQPVTPAPPLGDAGGFLDVLEKYGVLREELSAERKTAFEEYIRETPVATEWPIYESVTETSNFIIKQLNDAGAKFGGGSFRTSLLNEARDYYWVQYKENAAEPWVNVHPIFSHETPFQSPEAQTYINDVVPEALQHRLRFQVFVERKTGDQLEAFPVSSPWERPVANLVGVPLTFSNVADAMLDVKSLNQDLETLLKLSRTFVPSFGNSMAPGAQFFDIYGSIIDPLAATDSASGLFATISDAFASATGEIGVRSSIPTLTAQWMEFTLISPGGHERVFRRTTFDRIGSASRRAGLAPEGLEPTSIEDVRTLMQRHTFVVGVGAIPRGFVIDAAIKHFEEARPAIDAMMDLQYGRPPQPRVLNQIPTGWAGHPALMSLFDIAQSIGPGHRTYRSGPALVIHSEGLGNDSSHIEAIDIVSNPRRSVDVRPADPMLDPANVLQGGVWETAVEGALLKGGGGFNTWRAFETANSANGETLVILPGQEVKIRNFSPEAIDAIKADTANGYAVIIAGAGKSLENVGWWRIDLDTGQTLGQIRDGRGGELLETIVTMTISVGAFAYGASACMDISDPAARTCCLVANTGMAVSTVGIGLGLKGLAGAFAGATLDISRLAIPTATVCEAVFAASSLDIFWNDQTTFSLMSRSDESGDTHQINRTC